MGKSSSAIQGYHYRIAYHAGLVSRPIDAFLEYRAADKTAWAGELTSSGRFQINKPQLFGGEKDQGGIVGPVDLMFGDADQLPNPYLQSVLGNQVAAWRGMTTLAFCGGRYGAMSPFPQKPSYKIQKILKGWDNDDCWYPEKAKIAYAGEPAAYIDLVFGVNGGGAWGLFFTQAGDRTIEVPDQFYLSIAPVSEYNTTRRVRVFEADLLLWDSGWIGEASDQAELDAALIAAARTDLAGTINPVETIGIVINTLSPGTHTFHTETFSVMNAAGLGIIRNNVVAHTVDGQRYGMNPAHMLYYCRIDREKGNEPRENINNASLTAGADKLFAEGFGLCAEYDPEKDTPDSFEERICKIIGGSFERSLVDGQWYLTLARGDYDIDTLPILGDDDILEFRELPTTLDRAVNSLSVRHFDVERKETVITPAARALGLIRRFGEMHETLDMPEIPTARLALIVAMRELRARVTPTRAFELVTTPESTRYWLRNSYFRQQTLKRRIGDMVCILGEKQNGALRSGAIRIKVAQDIYSQDDTVYIDIETGVDTRPPQTPAPIESARAFEAPYIDVVANLPRADLEVLPNDVGYLLGVAAAPAGELNYSMFVKPDGGDYAFVANGEWCPNAATAGTVSAEPGPTVVALASVDRLDLVVVGSPVLLNGEICRVDTIDPEAPSVTLGRGCADTVPAEHAAGSRLWFFAENLAIDTTEYTAGETINVKPLTNTGSQQLAEGLATAMELTFDQRQFRPYPPGLVRINGEAFPGYLFGEVTVTWAHRDRVLQADQLADHEMASIGPEAGTTYTVRWYLGGVLVETHSAIVGTSQAYTPTDDGLLRVELESERDGVTSWQMHVRTMIYTTTETEPLTTLTGDPITTMAGEPIYLR